MYPVKQSTALTVPIFVHDSNGDAVTGMADGDFTKRISKNGGAFAGMTVTITEMENGWYSVPLSTSHTDTLGVLSLTFTESGSPTLGAKQVNIQLRVHARLPDDLAYPATSGRSIDVTTGGAVGIDWSNVENQGSSVTLSSTTVNDLTTKTGFSLAATGLDAITQSATGMVEIAKAVWDRALTGALHNIANSAGRRLRNIQDFGIYDEASVWVDEVAGTSTGTTDGEDATVTNRADDFDNAQTVATSVNIDRIRVQNGNAITLSATINNFNLLGEDWALALGGQDIGNCTIYNATVTGTGSGDTPVFRHCLIGTASLPPSLFYNCGLTSTLTLDSAGDFRFIDCQSGVAGASTPTVDLGGSGSPVGATTVEFRRWSGGLTLNNVAAGDVVSIDVVSGGIITVNGTGGTVVIRGMCNVVDGSGGSVSITETSVVNMTKINAEVVDALSVDTYAESASVPAATASLAAKIAWLATLARNKITQTATTEVLRNDDDDGNIATSTVSDNGTTFTRGEWT